MTASRLGYAAVTPARNEAANLRRLAACLQEQTLKPALWVVVDDGSTDETAEVVSAFADDYPWVRLVSLSTAHETAPGAPVVRAFQAGLEALGPWPEVVVKLDADVSAGSDYFERLVGAFEAEPMLGIASGNCLENDDGVWRPQPVTGAHVRGATRAYRRECLSELLPLEERMGWDGLDELKANVRGWTTRIVEADFFHHRRVGERDGARHRRWYAQGKGSHYMGYRFWYLALRTAHRARRDPAALAMLIGYAAAALRREPTFADAQVRAHLREQQSFRNLPRRAREALGRRA
jgi:glycosyltransferase involved in cell wall biosynthesis